MTEIDLADPQMLRALAHPIRLRILDVLRDQGSSAATATEISAVIGESVASCSYHLRILAKYGFVRPAEHRAGREKPWVAVSVSFSISTTGMSPADRGLADALARAGRQSFFELLERWAVETYSHPPEWQEASFSVGYDGLNLTSAELTSLRKDVADVVDGYGELAKGRPGSHRVTFHAWGVPVPGDADLIGATEPTPDHKDLS
jgi:DNA-binding transcriptional ArsR family regulator